MRISSLLYPSPSKSKASQPGITLSLGYPIIFHWLALGLVVGLLLIAVITHLTALLAITAFLVFLISISRLWSWSSLRRVSCHISLSHDRAFPGEKIDLTFNLANRKWLPLPWLEIETELPYRLVTGRLKTPSPYTKERLRWTLPVSPRQQAKWKHQLECKARGDYQLGPVRLRSGDFCGLFPREIVLPHFAPLLVYPQIDPLNKLVLPLKELFGESEMPRSIYDDASRTMGSRDYQCEDPFKRIHWKASAAHNRLQSRQYESTTSLSLLLILDVHSFCQQEPENQEPFEQAVTTVASLAYQAYRENSSVGLIANSTPEIQIPVHSGRSQLLSMLEALARIEARSNLPLHEQLEKIRAGLPMGATLVITTNAPTPTLAGLVHKLKQGGHSVHLVTIGKRALNNDFNPAPTHPGKPAGIPYGGQQEARS